MGGVGGAVLRMPAVRRGGQRLQQRVQRGRPGRHAASFQSGCTASRQAAGPAGRRRPAPPRSVARTARRRSTLPGRAPPPAAALPRSAAARGSKRSAGAQSERLDGSVRPQPAAPSTHMQSQPFRGQNHQNNQPVSRQQTAHAPACWLPAAGSTQAGPPPPPAPAPPPPARQSGHSRAQRGTERQLQHTTSAARRAAALFGPADA